VHVRWHLGQSGLRGLLRVGQSGPQGAGQFQEAVPIPPENISFFVGRDLPVGDERGDKFKEKEISFPGTMPIEFKGFYEFNDAF
jgi:hypothetical protein